MSDAVEDLHEVVYRRFLNAPWFADIMVEKGELGINPSDIARLLGTSRQRTPGKKGALVVIDRPIRDVEYPDIPGPEWKVRIPIGFYEHRTTNRGDGGTNKTIEMMISKGAALIHLFQIDDLGTQIVCSQDAVTPVVSSDKLQLIAELVVEATLNQQPEEKVSAPRVSGTADAVVISAGALYGITEGASVYYTTDGSYPTPDTGTFYGFYILNENGQPLISEDGQPLATENTPEPFAVAAGTLVRANAWLAGLQHSDLAGKRF